MGDISNTQYFKAVQEEKKLEVSQVLREVYEALAEKAMKLGEAVYKAAQEASANAGQENKPDEDGTRDADFSEKK